MAVSAVLKRFDRFFYQTRAGDGLTVPVDDGVLTFYPQGATLLESVSLEENATSTIPLHVYHAGTFTVTNAFHNPATVYSVDGLAHRSIEVWFNADGTVVIKNLGAQFNFPAGCRLLNSATPLNAYGGPQAQYPPIGVSTDQFGRALCYITAYRYDFVLSWATDSRHQVFNDAEGSYVTR